MCVCVCMCWHPIWQWLLSTSGRPCPFLSAGVSSSSQGPRRRMKLEQMVWGCSEISMPRAVSSPDRASWHAEHAQDQRGLSKYGGTLEAATNSWRYSWFQLLVGVSREGAEIENFGVSCKVWGSVSNLPSLSPREFEALMLKGQ